MELKNLSTMTEWWSGLDGSNGLTSAAMTYDRMIILLTLTHCSCCNVNALTNE